MMRSTAAVLIAALAAAPSAAQSARATPSPPAPPAPAFGGHLRLGGALFDNFFQSYDGETQEDEEAAEVEAGFHATVGRGAQLRGAVEYMRYRDFLPSTGGELGFHLDRRPHSLDARGIVVRGRPSRDVGDEFDRANGLGLAAQYGYRIGAWEPLALADAWREDYDLSPSKTNHVLAAGAGLRYRGFDRFSPEVGFRLGRRDVEDDAEDLRQREIYARLRWAPTRATYVGFRVRHRLRRYVVEDAASSNFGRRDTRTQAVANADFRTTSTIGLTTYYSIETSGSTRPGREFLTQMLAAGLVLRFERQRR